MGPRTQKEAFGIRLQKYKKMVGISTVRSYAIAICRNSLKCVSHQGRDGRPWTLQELANTCRTVREGERNGGGGRNRFALRKLRLGKQTHTNDGAVQDGGVPR